MLKDVMKALTLRKPISMTTTALTSGTFAARIAKSQRLHALHVAGPVSAGWELIEDDVRGGLFKTFGLDVQTTRLPDAAAALAAVSGGTADLALTDMLTALRARASGVPVQFIARSSGADAGYVALAAAVDAKRYAMVRFARALRERAGASYVDAADLQAFIDRCAAEQLIDRAFPAADLISPVAVMSGVR